MAWITVLGIAIGLGMDCFAVAIATGSSQQRLSPRMLFRLSWHFGLFQLLLTVAGWYLGSGISRYIDAYDHWLAFGLLAYVGGRMIRESITHHPDQHLANDPTRGWTLIFLSVATSIDAFAVGLSMAFLGVHILMPSVVIGVVTVAMTIVGMLFGRTLGAAFGKRMTLIGGILLIGMGIKIVINHLA